MIKIKKKTFIFLQIIKIQNFLKVVRYWFTIIKLHFSQFKLRIKPIFCKTTMISVRLRAWISVCCLIHAAIVSICVPSIKLDLTYSYTKEPAFFNFQSWIHIETDLNDDAVLKK